MANYKLLQEYYLDVWQLCKALSSCPVLILPTLPSKEKV